MMMAMVRLNCPSVFVYGGAMLPGHWRGRDVTVLTAYEGVGQVLANTMTEGELQELERACAPTIGSCPGQFTANTMAMVSETLGLAPPGSAMLPAVYSQRLALARRAGRRLTEILGDGGPLPRDLVTRKALENAAAAVAATGGSTNAGLHLPAIAHEAGITFSLEDVAQVFARTPLLADLQPGGKYLALDLFRAGGTDAVLKALLDGGYLHGETLTLSGTTLSPAPGRTRGSRWRGGAAGVTPLQSLRRIGHAARKPCARGRADQDRRADDPHLRGPGPGVRQRGSLHGRGGGTPIPGRRGADHPL